MYGARALALTRARSQAAGRSALTTRPCGVRACRRRVQDLDDDDIDDLYDEVRLAPQKMGRLERSGGRVGAEAAEGRSPNGRPRALYCSLGRALLLRPA